MITNLFTLQEDILYKKLETGEKWEHNMCFSQLYKLKQVKENKRDLKYRKRKGKATQKMYFKGKLKKNLEYTDI